MRATGTYAGRDEIAGIVLAAGEGRRLRPLTFLRPKPLCPVGGLALVDHALARVAAETSSVAVNVHHLREQMEAHLDGRVHLSIEEPEALGTAGALGHLRDWIDGRPALVVNGDTWCPAPLGPLLDGWDGARLRLYVAGLPAGEPPPRALAGKPRVAGALLPWSEVSRLRAEPSGLWEASWRFALDDDRLEVVPAEGPFVDCSTPAAYLAANLAVSGGASVVDPSAVVEGTVERCVLWPGTVVRAGEHLVDSIRADDHVTVLVR